MRGIYTPVIDVRRKVFTEVARMSYQGGSSSDYGEQMRKLPYKIIPGEESTHNMNIWLERAIVSERIRLAMGLSLRPISQQVATDEGLEHSVIADKYY